MSSLSGSVPSRHHFGHCSDLLQMVSPAFDRTEAFLGETFPTNDSLLEVSLEMRPPREFSFGFDAIKVSFQRCSALQYSIVQKLFLEKYFPHTPVFQRSLWKCVPPVSSLSGSEPSRHIFGAVPNYYRRSLQYSIVQKLLLGIYFPHTPAFQRSLWKTCPPLLHSSLQHFLSLLVKRCILPLILIMSPSVGRGGKQSVPPDTFM